MNQCLDQFENTEMYKVESLLTYKVNRVGHPNRCQILNAGQWSDKTIKVTMDCAFGIGKKERWNSVMLHIDLKLLKEAMTKDAYLLPYTEECLDPLYVVIVCPCDGSCK